jgi:hypothetical protein
MTGLLAEERRKALFRRHEAAEDVERHGMCELPGCAGAKLTS